jgi:hypothetical protein
VLNDIEKTDRFATSADDAIKHGQEVETLRVEGRTRDFWGTSSRRAEWSSISRTIEGAEKFTFSANPEQDVHALETESGRILVYEGRKREVVGQLDFVRDVQRVQKDNLQLRVLELGVSTMLLLEDRGNEQWRRIGVAWNVREDFFATAAHETLILV